MDPSDIAESLDDDDQLSLHIGRVARTHALLDSDLRNVHRTLAAPGPASFLSSGIFSTDRLADDCLLMLNNSGLDSELTEAGTGALLAARDANALRNRIVHDMWLPSPGGPAPDDPLRWNAFRASRGHLGPVAAASPRDLDYIRSARSKLERARLRVSGLFMALHEALPGNQESVLNGRSESRMPRYIALMSDRFELVGNGDFRVDIED